MLAQGRAKKKTKEDRTCGDSTALFFFFFCGGLNLEQVQVPAVQKMSRERERDRDC